MRRGRGELKTFNKEIRFKDVGRIKMKKPDKKPRGGRYEIHH